MEKLPVNPVNKVELPKTEQSVEHFSLSEQEKNIQKVFKLSPGLKTIASDSLGIEDDKDIVIELGRNKEEASLGKIQNINVYYKGELILNSDDKSQSKKLILVTQKDGNSFVGDILLPEELQGKGLGAKILQKVSNELNTKIVPSHTLGSHHTSPSALRMWEKVGNEILPNHEAEKLYAEYLKTIFPESKVQEILFHTTSATFENFGKEYISRGNVSFGEGFYFTDKIDNHKNFKGGDKIVPVVVNIDKIYKDSVEEKDRREKPKYNPYVNSHERLLEVQKQHNEFLEKNFDGVIATYNNKNEFVVFEPENIHILGSKSDIEKFKEFVSKNESKNNKQSIEEFLKEQGLEKVPKIEIDFYFTNHQTKEAGEGLVKRLNSEDIDIFMPEGSGVTPEIKEEYQKLSNGEIKPEEIFKSMKLRGIDEDQLTDFHKLYCEGLYNSHKKVLLVDIPANYKDSKGILRERIDFAWEKYNKVTSDFADRNILWEDLKSRLLSFAKDYTTAQKDREDFILDNMKTEIFKLLQNDKTLQNKENLKILFPMGSFHTRLYHEIKKSGNIASREFDEGTPYNYDTILMQLKRAVYFGKEKSTERSIIDFILVLLRVNMGKNISQETWNQMLNFSEQQTHELFEIYKKSESDEKFADEAQIWVVEQLKNKN